jgi:predicted MFS family arabinose efflux permease
VRLSVVGDKRFGGLWRHPDFLKLWAGQTVSLGGSLVSRVALPLVAILTLDATPGEVAVLRIADLLPGILLGLFAGVWVDRLRRRPLMIWSDVGRAVLLGSIPLAAIFGLLRIEQLWLVVFAAGLLTALFEVAYHTYLPTLVSRDALVEGNSKLEASGAAIEVASFGLGGWLVQVLSAPIAVLIDAVSFVVSAVCLWTIKAPEPRTHETGHEQNTWLAIREGLRLVLHDPVLRALGLAHANLNLCIYIWLTMLLVFLARDLELEPAVFGVLFAVGGVCSLIGATQAERVERRLGLGPTLILMLFIDALGLLLVPLASGPYVMVLAFVAGQQLADGPATIYQIHERSLIQATVPDHSLGRVTASLRVVGWTAMLAGTMIGGVLAETLGARTTMYIGAIGALPAALWLFWSPVRRLRQI